MNRDYRTRVFKSGNSLALRLPRTLGFVEGEDVTIIPHRDGSFSIWRAVEAKRAFMALGGRMSAGFMAEGREAVDSPERDWSAAGGTAEAA